MKNPQQVKDEILSDEIIQSVTPVLKKAQTWLVGGFIRDLFQDLHSDDRDIVTLGSSKDLALELADKLSGTFVELDNENEIYRVVLEDKKTYFDVSRALEDDIVKDAKRRDFGINSIFFDLNKEEFYDPRSGILDIENKIIKTCDIKNLEDDPLRMLRAFRFMSLCGFNIDLGILNFVDSNAEKIHNCAFERINCEIIKLFEGENLLPALLEADKYGLLTQIFPFINEIKKISPNSHHHLDLFHHSLETMNKIRINKPLLKLAAFCHDIGKPTTHTIEPSGRHRFIGHDEVGSKLIKPILSDLKFSKKQIEYVSLMIKNHIYPSALMCEQGASDKAKIRFIRKLEPFVEDVIELARADRLSARGPAVSDEMVEQNLHKLEILLEYYHKIKPALEQLPKLIDGKEIMEILKMPASPKLGEIIDALKEAQIEGIVKNREDAIEFVKKCNK